jgi:5-formyltetrahydrofolate cyclo-ligase
MIHEEKRALRRQLVAAREAVPASEREVRAARAIERLLALREFVEAPTVMAFVSVKGELPTGSLLVALFAHGKRVLVPQITPEGLVPMAVRSIDDLVPGVHGIPTGGGPAWEGPIAAIVVPGAGFTPRGERIGMGKAYYDGFLAKHPEAFTCGLCWDEQIVEYIPMEAHDRRIQAIATPGRLYRP